jgi:phosphatidylserine decarboxylase
MSRPLPLPVWDCRAGKLVEEMSHDHPATYESRPRRSVTQWLKSHPLFDGLAAAYEDAPPWFAPRRAISPC